MPGERKTPVAKAFIAGSFSGTCSTVLFQPLDLIKTRLQTQVMIQPGSVGMLNTFGSVIKNEQLFGLWKGMSPSLVRCVPGVGMYFSTLYWLQENFGSDDPHPVESVALGMMARSLSGLSLLPITVIKTRYESGMFKYNGMLSAMQVIYAKEGARGLYSGLLPTLARDAPFSGLYLMFYTQSKKAVPTDYFSPAVLPVVHFSCGVLAGLCASTITQPADVIKTKMQIFPHFQSVPEVMAYVHQKYGVKGYFKGLAPRALRRTLMAAMAWTVYEQLMHVFGIKSK